MGQVSMMWSTFSAHAKQGHHPFGVMPCVALAEKVDHIIDTCPIKEHVGCRITGPAR